MISVNIKSDERRGFVYSLNLGKSFNLYIKQCQEILI